MKVTSTPSRVPGLLERLYEPIIITKKIDTQPRPINNFFLEESPYKYLDGNQLAYPYHFQITGFSLIPAYSSISADLYKLIDGAFFTFKIAQKEYLSIPLNGITYCSHIQGYPQTNGEPLACSKLKISEPVFQFPEDSWPELIPLQPFQATMQIPEPLALSQPLLLHLYMFGYKLRPVY